MSKKADGYLKQIEGAVNDLDHVVRHATSGLKLIAKTMGVRVKDPAVMDGVLLTWHPMLKKIFLWICKKYPGEVTVTSGYRKDSTGIHKLVPLRAVDLRSREFDNPKAVEKAINDYWDYGHPNKKELNVCLYHRTVRCKKCGTKFEVDPDKGTTASTACPGCSSKELKDGGSHFHLQCRDSTHKKR